MLIICGALVNGPYALITTAVSADLVRGALQTPPRCPCTPRGCSGCFAGIFALCLCFPIPPRPSGEGQSCHTWCCAPHSPLNTVDFPVFTLAIWLCFSFAASPSEHKQSGNIWWQIPWEFLPAVGDPGFAMVWLQTAFEFDPPIHGCI